jgi:hypothetical protein
VVEPRKYASFKKARSYIRRLGFKSTAEWIAHCRTDKLPPNIPSNPGQIYAEAGWAGIRDWLGTELRRARWRPFDEAKAFAMRLGFKSRVEWYEYCASGKKPNDIPANPNSVYARAGWSSWFNWLGAGRHREAGWQPFGNARAFVQGLGLKSHSDWIKYCASGKKPHNVPSGPSTVYAKAGWKSWGDWLGTGTIAPSLYQYQSFKSARKFVRGLGLKSRREWLDYCKSGRKPTDIPTSPHKTYANKGWSGIGNWLGTGKPRRGAHA